MHEPVVAIQIVRPGHADIVFGLSCDTSVELLTRTIAQHRWPNGCRIRELGVGEWQVGDSCARPLSPLPRNEAFIRVEDALPLRLRPRRLWVLRAEGIADHLLSTSPEMNGEEVGFMIRHGTAFRESQGRATVIPVGLGRWPIQRTLFSYNEDSRWIDEHGFLQLHMPVLEANA